MDRFRPPLHVYVYWREPFALGAQLYRALFRTLNRDLGEPESRGIGIPVYGRGDLVDDALAPDAIPQGVRRVRVILIDSGAADDDVWVAAVRGLVDRSAGELLLPVLVQRAPIRDMDQRLSAIHAINISTASDVAAALERGVVHELARLLLARPRPVDAPSSAAPVRLFLSHAKRDGLPIARALKEQIEEHSAADTFFDAHDITPGAPFPLEIFKSIEHSALIVAQTDAYASREWCRREVIEAKKYSRPVVVINAIKFGEERGFPYLGNVPTVRWDFAEGNTENAARALDLALKETLRTAYFRELWIALAPLLAPDPSVLALARPPELLLPTVSANPGQMVVYPDPPLGDEELQLLATHRSEIRPMTPLTLMWRAFGHEERPLEGKTISVSLSAPSSAQLRRRGLDLMHVEDVAIECARYLLASGAGLAYGGDLRTGGFTEKLVTLVRRHNHASGDPFHRLENYLAWHIHVGTASSADVLSCRERRVDLPADVPVDERRPDSALARARGLTAMREAILSASSAHLLLGGATDAYEGRVPGVLEEASLAVGRGVPLFVAGGFGGASGVVADVMLGGQPHSSSFGPGKGDRTALQRAYAGSGDDAGTDVASLLAKFAGALTRLNNGLSESENHVLLTTMDHQEIVFWVMTGLARLAGESKRDRG